MVAPSKSFTVIPDSDIDPDSPITTGLMTSLRDNDVHLEEWLGKDFVAAVNHSHDGIDSKKITVGFTLVEHKTLSASATSVSFTGLDGDTDFHFRLIMRVKSGFDGSFALDTIDLRPNGSLLTAARTLEVTSAGRTDDTASIWNGGIGTGLSVGAFVDIIGVRTVEATVEPFYLAWQGFSESGTGGTHRSGGGSFASGANLTTFDVQRGVANKGNFDVGSHFTLYRVSPI